MPAHPAEETVCTRAVFPAPPPRVWRTLLFYEQVDEPPPWWLRVLLPTPKSLAGSKSAVGDEAMCHYTEGHLKKRVTAIEPERRYEFEVAEQQLHVCSVALQGGHYVLRAHADGRTLVEAATRYHSPLRPRWLFRPIERFVCHRFHRFLLGAMQRRLSS